MWEVTVEHAVMNREFKWIYHFTKLENLSSILTDGIVPRETLEAKNAIVSYSDTIRLDGQKRASCFSIGHPNYKMFYSLRQQDKGQEWIVIACKREVLWLKECAFCLENAASNNVTNIPIQDRKGVAAFEKLFVSINGMPTREEMQLLDSYPTNPQAEVLVFDVVEPQYILGAYCQTKERASELKEKYPAFQFSYKSFPFSYRRDYIHWK
jgi:hypothetical protein